MDPFSLLFNNEQTNTTTTKNTSTTTIRNESQPTYPKLPIHDLLDLIDQVFASRSNSQAAIQVDMPISPITMTATASCADMNMNLDLDLDLDMGAIVGSKPKYEECVVPKYDSYGKELAEILADEHDRHTSNQIPVSQGDSDKHGAEEGGNEVEANHEEVHLPKEGDACQSDQVAFQMYLDQVLKTQFSTVVGEQCMYCPDRVFWRRHDLVRHIKTSHLMERPFECEQCHNRFKRKSHLEIHVRAVHERLGRFPCKLCQKVYSSDSTRRKHIRTQHNCEDYD